MVIANDLERPFREDEEMEACNKGRGMDMVDKRLDDGGSQKKGEGLSGQSGESLSDVDQELTTRSIVATMKEAGRASDIRTRRQLAINLGRILHDRKELLDLSTLVVDAGISENSDPSRLGRFRILPGKEPGKEAVQRLSQKLDYYLSLIRSIAEQCQESENGLINDLVVATRFESLTREDVPIEPCEQMFSLISKRIDVIDAKYDLQGYYQTARYFEMFPVWDPNRLFHSEYAPWIYGKRPKCEGWSWNYGAMEPELKFYQPNLMPSVPLLRIRAKDRRSAEGTLRIGSNFQIENALIEQWHRLFLCIGMFRHNYWEEYVDDKGEVKEREIKKIDRKPAPYVVVVNELRYTGPFFEDGEIKETLDNALAEAGISESDLVIPGVIEPRDSDGKCGACYPEASMDHPFSIELSNAKLHSSHRNISKSVDGEWVSPTPTNMYPQLIWSNHRLDVRFIRDVLAIDRGISLWSGWYDDDALSRAGIGWADIEDITLAPKHSILEDMEKDLFLGLSQDVTSKSSFLDRLEEDAQILTTSLHNWVSKKRAEVRSRHEELLRQHDEQIEKAKDAPVVRFDSLGIDQSREE